MKKYLVLIGVVTLIMAIGSVAHADAIWDGEAVAKYLKRWAEFAPTDPNLKIEYTRMRIHFPENVPPIEDGLKAL